MTGMRRFLDGALAPIGEPERFSALVEYKVESRESNETQVQVQEGLEITASLLQRNKPSSGNLGG